MIVRESYSERRDGASLELLYTATFLPDAATLRGLLQSAGILFTVVTPEGAVYGPLHKERIELEGAPGANAPATARIRYRQDASDLLAAGTPVLVEAAPPAGTPPAAAPGPIALPLQSHHWTLAAVQAYAAPAWELRCDGTCDGLPATRTALLAGLGGAAVSVPTPQFGVVDAMAKVEASFGAPSADGSIPIRLVWRGLPPADPDAFPQVEIVATTGRTPGSCTLTKASRSAAPALSQELGQLLSYQGLFAGRIANVDRYVSSDGLYTASVTALDARWDMAGVVIGTAPLAAGTLSYARRGYEWVFNRHGLPDKDVAAAAFHDGDGAAYWTFGDILSHLSDAYMPASVGAVPAWEGLSGAADVPGETDLRGKDLATAIDFLLAQIGYTWTLRYDAAVSTATLHAFGNTDTDGTVAVPLGSIVTNPGAAAHAGKAETIQDAWGQTEFLSAPALCQCGFASAATGSFAGFAPLVRRASDDADHAYEYRPDFSGISAWFPFLDDRTGAGYRLHPELASRLAEGVTLNGYAPARASAAAGSPTVSIPAASHFWVTWNDLGGAWRRVAGGISLRVFPATVLVRRRIAVYSAGATQARPKAEQVRPLDHAGFQIAGTLAFVSDHRASALAGSGGALAAPRVRTATRPELVPAYACAWAGDAFDPGDLNAFSVFSPLTTLVDVQAQLDALAAAAQAAQTPERVQSSALLAYWPAGIGAAVGRTLALDGAFFSGPEAIVTGYTLRRDGKTTCLLRATSQPLSAGQGRLAEAAAARGHFLKKLHP